MFEMIDCGHRKDLGDDYDWEDEDPPRSTPVVEVFNIIYLGQDEVKPEKQLGTIIFHTCPGIYYLYNVNKVDRNKPSIQFGDIIPLTIKSPCFGFKEEFVKMEFDLFCGAFKGIVYLRYDPIASGVSLTSVEIDSTDNTGRIVVNLGAFPDATIAKLDLKLVNNSAPVTISGAIYASNANVESSNAASLLFHGNNLVVGHDGVIPLNKSIVGLPLRTRLYVEIFLKIDGVTHTANLQFDAKETGQQHKISQITGTNAKILVKITWGDFGDPELISQQENTLSVVNHQRMLSLGKIGSLDMHHNEPMEKVMAELGSSSSITYIFLSWLYKSEVDIRVAFIKILHPVVLFNLIQVAHRFQIKSIMDLACHTLAVKFKTKAHEGIMEKIRKEFSMDIFYIRTGNLLKRISNREACVKKSLEILSESRRFPYGNGDIIMRQRGKETLINISYFLDVPIYPFATERMPVVTKRNLIFDRCVADFLNSMPEPRNLDKLLEATRWLNNLINGDPGFADCLCPDAVKNLQRIVSEIFLFPDQKRGAKFCIQMCAVHVLSRAVSRRTHRKYLKDAVQSFVKLMSEPQMDFKEKALTALTHLAYACPDSRSIIFEKGALEAALKLATNSYRSGDYELLYGIAKFLAVVCSSYFPEDKVKVALAILEIVLEKRPCFHYEHVVSACYALQYLTYGRPEESGEVWNKIIRRLVEVICNCFPIGNATFVSLPCGVVGVAGSVLGVLGNIARWGCSRQIKSLVGDKDLLLLRCLGEVLRCGVEKFSKEACQIISNIAARGDTWILEMHIAKLIEPLCSLLETDMYDPDARMEAAWAIYNGIYGDKYRPIDVYPEKLSDGDRM